MRCDANPDARTLVGGDDKTLIKKISNGLTEQKFIFILITLQEFISG